MIRNSALSTQVGADGSSTNWDRACRWAGLVVGIAVQILFGVTVVGLYWFLSSGTQRTGAPFYALDAALALAFAVPHSVLRLPMVQKRISARLGREFFGLFYCAVTCATLWLLFTGWRGSERMVWNLAGLPRAAVSAAFQLSWAALAYSLCLTGLGYQTGFTEWNYWRRYTPLPRRQFIPRGAYLWIRHPVYLSFAGLVWFNPQMTVDRLLLAAIWTVYLAVGSYLKDERLASYMGQEYRRYQAQVRGYPLVSRGPLGKRRMPEQAEATESERLRAA